jgi:anti-sigma regulatory factor (Ser/Thr protein kinase)
MSLTHDTFIYESDEDFVNALAPFLLEGTENGEATYAVTTRHNCALLEEALGPQGEAVNFIDSQDWYLAPARTIASYAATIRRARAAGYERLRVVGEVEFGDTPTTHAEWTRYEAALNVAFESQPAWIICPYDRRRLSEEVVEDSLRTHPHQFGASLDRSVCSVFEEPASFCSSLPLLVEGEPVGEIEIGGDFRAVRQFVAARAQAAGVRRDRIADVVLAVNELAVNAIRHGSPPASIRMWDVSDAVVFEVADDGPGLRDPLSGFLPPVGSPEGGAGMWLVRQLGDRVEILPDARGTRVRVRVEKSDRAVTRDGEVVRGAH